MGRDFSDFTISEQDETIAKYGLTNFEDYIASVFPRFSEAERLAVLMQWDSAAGFYFTSTWRGVGGDYCLQPQA